MRLIYILCLLLLFISCEKGAGDIQSNALDSKGAGGSLARFTIVDNYLYMVDNHMLSVVDITDPAKPEEKGKVFAGFDIETIFSYKDKLYLGASNGMYIFSLADPLQPQKEGSVSHFRACDPVVSNDSVAYVTLRSNGSTCGSNKNVLMIYNVKDSKNPVLVKEVGMQSPYGLGINSKSLYVCEGTYGLVTYDLTDPYNPFKTAGFDEETFYDVIPYEDVLIAFTAKGFCFFDIETDPLKPVLIGKAEG